MWVIVIPIAQWNETLLCLYASGKFDLVCLNYQSYEINDQTTTQVIEDLKVCCYAFYRYIGAPLEEDTSLVILFVLCRFDLLCLNSCIQKHTY
jgi:hypothetical protein